MTTFSVAMSEVVNEALLKHLARKDSQEDLCFAVWFPSDGENRLTALIHELVLPGEGERVLHGNAEFLPQYFERALQIALKRRGGLAFMHSHPAWGWQGMSQDDENAERGMAGAVLAATGLPLVGLTAAAKDGAWSGRFWNRAGPRRYSRDWCATVRVVGRRLSASNCDLVRPPPRALASQVRTLSSWGEQAQSNLARLRIGVVGLGSVGSIVSEALARFGVERVTLLDFDNLDEVNLDRTLGAGLADAEEGIAKVELAARCARRSATSNAFVVEASDFSVCEEGGYRKALDCDLLFSCVDRPWPRSVLNFIAYAHLIPVVDGGIHVSRKPKGTLRGADWKAHIAGPTHRCLECLGQYKAEDVAADREGYFDDPKYIESLPSDHPARSRQNVFAFSLAVASLEVLQLLSMVIAPSGLGSPGAQTYHFVPGIIDLELKPCELNCDFPRLEGRGDSAGHPGTGQHPAAERARRAKAATSESPPSLLERICKSPSCLTSWLARLVRAIRSIRSASA